MSPPTVLVGPLMAAVGALLLAACGSSGTGKTTTRATVSKAAAAARSSRTTRTTATSAAANASATGPTCRRVPMPPTKSNEREPKPELKLDPARTYTVRLATNCGTITIELDVAHAPKTAASFAWLVERGFYNNLTFHRVVPGFVIQGGDPNGNGTGGPGYQVVEAPPANVQYTEGVVAMAKTETEPSGASGSQFFIVTAANASLPPQYALVGRVVSGEGSVDAISKVPTEAGQDGEHSTPNSPVVIEKATLHES